jgi:hypothetical protein
MKPVFLSIALLSSAVLWAADSTKDEVKAAAQKLAAAPNYSWRTTVETGPNSRFRPGPTEGKTEKDGYTFLSMVRGDNTIEAALKNNKAAFKREGEWQLTSEVTEDNGGARFLARALENYKTPALDAQELASKVKDLKKDGDSYKGDLPADTVKDLMFFRGRRPGGDTPEPGNPKGWVKFWVKDGQLVKYEYNVQGTVNFNGNDVEVDRTSTIEIKDVGTTKVTVPEDAKKKLS